MLELIEIEETEKDTFHTLIYMGNDNTEWELGVGKGIISTPDYRIVKLTGCLCQQCVDWLYRPKPRLG